MNPDHEHPADAWRQVEAEETRCLAMTIGPVLLVILLIALFFGVGAWMLIERIAGLL